uniref:Uncharacterized protein n=1 Tax=Timema bartmani TaxID=61472 RepID=A0A7R9FBM5_9NEOP|nr:unnamed protein product [Timema bartmani]
MTIRPRAQSLRMRKTPLRPRANSAPESTLGYRPLRMSFTAEPLRENLPYRLRESNWRLQIAESPTKYCPGNYMNCRFL